jgi:hypothetical protein
VTLKIFFTAVFGLVVLVVPSTKGGGIQPSVSGLGTCEKFPTRCFLLIHEYSGFYYRDSKGRFILNGSGSHYLSEKYHSSLIPLTSFRPVQGCWKFEKLSVNGSYDGVDLFFNEKGEAEIVGQNFFWPSHVPQVRSIATMNKVVVLEHKPYYLIRNPHRWAVTRALLFKLDSNGDLVGLSQEIWDGILDFEIQKTRNCKNK